MKNLIKLATLALTLIALIFVCASCAVTEPEPQPVSIASVQPTYLDRGVEIVITMTDGTQTSFFITNGVNGADGKDGLDGKDGKDGVNGVNGIDGKDGKDGTNGADGVNGKSAYELALSNGYAGTEEDWLKSFGYWEEDTSKEFNLSNFILKDYYSSSTDSGWKFLDALASDEFSLYLKMSNMTVKTYSAYTHCRITLNSKNLRNVSKIKIKYAAGYVPSDYDALSIDFETDGECVYKVINTCGLGTALWESWGIYNYEINNQHCESVIVYGDFYIPAHLIDD